MYINSYYGNSYAKYRCAMCGKESYGKRGILQCAQCLTPLCEQCNHSGFCSQHYDQLTIEEKNYINTLSRQYSQFSQKFIAGIIFGMVFFIPMMVFFGISTRGIAIPLIIIPMIIFFVGTAISVQTKYRNYQAELNSIAQKYRNPIEYRSISPNQNQPSTYTQPSSYSQPSTFSNQEVKHPEMFENQKLEARYCSSCGAKIQNGVQFCSYCGIRLI